MKGKSDARAASPRNNSVRGRLARMDVRGALRKASRAVRGFSIDEEDPISSQSYDSDDGVAVPQRQPPAPTISLSDAGAEVSAQQTSNRKKKEEKKAKCAALRLRSA